MTEPDPANSTPNATVDTDESTPPYSDPAAAAAGGSEMGSTAGIVGDDAPESAADATGPDQLTPSSWSFVDVLAGLGVLLIVNTAMQAVIAFSDVQLDRSVLVLLSMATVWFALLATSWWASRRHGTGNVIKDYGLTFRWQDLWVGGLAGIALRIAAMLIAGLAVSMTHYRGGGGANSNIPVDSSSSAAMVIVVAVASIVIAPVVEEVFFRGLVLRSALASLQRRSFQPRFGKATTRFRIAALVSAALFAGVHITEARGAFTAVILVVSLFLVGWVNARLTLWSQRLGPAILSHAVFNATAVAFLLLA